MIGRRHELARLQSDLYRDSYYRILKRIIISCMIMLFLVLAIIYFILFTTPPTYYGTATTGQIIPMTPQRS